MLANYSVNRTYKRIPNTHSQISGNVKSDTICSSHVVPEISGGPDRYEQVRHLTVGRQGNLKPYLALSNASSTDLAQHI